MSFSGVQDAGSAEAPGLVAEANATLKALESALSAWQLRALLGGPYDAGSAVISIQVCRGRRPFAHSSWRLKHACTGMADAGGRLRVVEHARPDCKQERLVPVCMSTCCCRLHRRQCRNCRQRRWHG